MTSEKKPCLSGRGLTKIFGLGNQKTLAVDHVDFDFYEGEIVSIVGESGSGKTTLAKMLLGLISTTEGEVSFLGKPRDIRTQKKKREYWQNIQAIFQDPFSSLNPRMSVGRIIAEPIKNYENLPKSEIRQRVAELMNRVGLRPAQMGRYPHEFSGGQRQRIGIARALAVKPDVIICDEAVSALDVSIQAQIINLLKDLQEEMNLAYLFIAHDLSVVEYISHRVAVMYLGRIVELAPDRILYKNPLHPYTKALLSAVPIPDPLADQEQEIVLSGDVPSPLDPPEGCTFHPRCPMAMDQCRTRPVYREIEPDHWIACHLYP